MAQVAPLPGLRFSGPPLAEVIAPPYDVISPEEQARLYARSPYNVIRLELGREPDRYAEARREYHAWRAAGILRQDEPSFYLYEQGFEGRVRRGLLARVGLEPWSAGVILPHEETFPKHKADRLELLRAVKANVSPILALYDDPAGQLRSLFERVAAGPPLAEAIDEAGELHRLWRFEEAGVEPFFRDKQLFIADGHHRYETALTYRDEISLPQPSGEKPEGARGVAGFVLMALVDFHDPGLVVLPTHRLISDLPQQRLHRLVDRLGSYFEVLAAAEQVSPKSLDAALRELESVEGPAFVLYGPQPSGLRLIRLSKPVADTSHSAVWNQLDVAALATVLERALELSPEEVAGERFIGYTREAEFAVRQVQRGEAQLAFLLRPTPSTAIREVALSQEKMPRKSTYFYPKLATGLVINPLD